MTFQEHALSLVRYYARLCEEKPSDPEGPIGRRLAEQWLALIDAPNPDQSRISTLLRELDAIELGRNHGSGMLDLMLGIRAWARIQERL
jgi:hypothetical protein